VLAPLACELTVFTGKPSMQSTTDMFRRSAIFMIKSQILL